MCLLITELGDLSQACFAKQGEINSCAERDQALIGANVGRGAFAFDMLLAGGQGEDVGTLALIIDRFADQTSRHLVDEMSCGS